MNKLTLEYFKKLNNPKKVIWTGNNSFKGDDGCFFVKDIKDATAVEEVISAKLFHTLQIPTPPIYIKDNSSNTFDSTSQIITPSAYDIDDFKFKLARDAFRARNLSQLKAKEYHKWQVFYDKELQNELLKFMTPECLEELETLFLVDELRTECDRHHGNYLFYKEPQADKFQGIVPIDNQLTAISVMHPRNRLEFLTFKVNTFSTHTILSNYSSDRTHKTALIDIIKLLHNNALSDSQIGAIKATLKFDMAKAVKDACKLKPLKTFQSKAYNAHAYLWEYNRKLLGNEFNL